MMHVVGPGDLGQGLASLSAGQRLSLLMLSELWLAPEVHALRPGPLSAFPCACSDQFTLEFCAHRAGSGPRTVRLSTKLRQIG